MNLARFSFVKFLTALLAVFSLLGCKAGFFQKQDRVCFKEQCVRTEIARTQEAFYRGLQFRDSLGQNEGMLFIFPMSQIHSFWMKDTRIALDIIWLDHFRRVVHIAKNVPPCKKDPCPIYSPSSEALYVLEVNASWTDRFGVQVGDLADFFLKK